MVALWVFGHFFCSFSIGMEFWLGFLNRRYPKPQSIFQMYACNISIQALTNWSTTCPQMTLYFAWLAINVGLTVNCVKARYYLNVKYGKETWQCSGIRPCTVTFNWPMETNQTTASMNMMLCFMGIPSLNIGLKQTCTIGKKIGKGLPISLTSTSARVLADHWMVLHLELEGTE